MIFNSYILDFWLKKVAFRLVRKKSRKNALSSSKNFQGSNVICLQNQKLIMNFCSSPNDIIINELEVGDSYFSLHSSRFLIIFTSALKYFRHLSFNLEMMIFFTCVWISGVIIHFLLSSIHIRWKYWIRKNFRLPVFDGFTCFEMSWTRFDYF